MVDTLTRENFRREEAVYCGNSAKEVVALFGEQPLQAPMRSRRAVHAASVIRRILEADPEASVKMFADDDGDFPGASYAGIDNTNLTAASLFVIERQIEDEMREGN